MNKIEAIAQAIKTFSPAELSAFRSWFQAFDTEMWNRQIVEDATSGKLDALANTALKSQQFDDCTEF